MERRPGKGSVYDSALRQFTGTQDELNVWLRDGWPLIGRASLSRTRIKQGGPN